MAETTGLLIVNTGDGKGKTTAALGVLFRALGRNMKCAMVRFIKGKWKTGEAEMANKLGLEFHTCGRGFTWESDDIEKDKATAQEGWNKAKEIINDPSYQVVVLDELTYTINYNFLDKEDVLETLRNKPKEQHLIITGRDCPQEILDMADLVTEMKLHKHPYEKGIMAQKGVEF